MSPARNRILGLLIVVACVAAALYVVIARGANPTAGIGAVIGVIVVLIISNRARNKRPL